MKSKNLTLTLLVTVLALNTLAFAAGDDAQRMGQARAAAGQVGDRVRAAAGQVREKVGQALANNPELRAQIRERVEEFRSKAQNLKDIVQRGLAKEAIQQRLDDLGQIRDRIADLAQQDPVVRGQVDALRTKISDLRAEVARGIAQERLQQRLDDIRDNLNIN